MQSRVRLTHLLPLIGLTALAGCRGGEASARESDQQSLLQGFPPAWAFATASESGVEEAEPDPYAEWVDHERAASVAVAEDPAGVQLRVGPTLRALCRQQVLPSPDYVFESIEQPEAVEVPLGGLVRCLTRKGPLQGKQIDLTVTGGVPPEPVYEALVKLGIAAERIRVVRPAVRPPDMHPAPARVDLRMTAERRS